MVCRRIIYTIRIRLLSPVTQNHWLLNVSTIVQSVYLPEKPTTFARKGLKFQVTIPYKNSVKYWKFHYNSHFAESYRFPSYLRIFFTFCSPCFISNPKDFFAFCAPLYISHHYWVKHNFRVRKVLWEEFGEIYNTCFVHCISSKSLSTIVSYENANSGRFNETSFVWGIHEIRIQLIQLNWNSISPIEIMSNNSLFRFSANFVIFGFSGKMSQ